MGKFVPWSSQPLNEWAERYARGKFIDLDGHQTHYIEKGKGEPVILVHGFYYDSHMWDSNIDALAEKFKVYVIDLWGFGYSTRDRFDFGYPLYSHQLLHFMDTLKIPKASLIGQSMGGGTIIHFVVDHRDRIEKIILIEPSALPNKLPLMGKISNLSGVGELLFGLNSNFPRKMTLESAFIYNNKHITDEYFERVTRFQKVEGTTEIMLKILRKRFFFTLEIEVNNLGGKGVPTLIVAGRQSTSIPIEINKKVHSILEGSKLEIFDQAGHCPHDEHPEKFNRIAIEFLLE